MTPLVITAIVIAYVVVAGLVWQLFERSENDALEMLSIGAGVYWPLVPVVGLAIALGYVLAYRAPKWAIERVSDRLRPKLPRAEVRR